KKFRNSGSAVSGVMINGRETRTSPRVIDTVEAASGRSQTRKYGNSESPNVNSEYVTERSIRTDCQACRNRRSCSNSENAMSAVGGGLEDGPGAPATRPLVLCDRIPAPPTRAIERLDNPPDRR